MANMQRKRVLMSWRIPVALALIGAVVIRDTGRGERTNRA